MPTYEGTEHFWHDFRRLTPAQQKLFLVAVKKFVYDLKMDDIRAGLRVKDFHGSQGMYEMTWAPDGRALFRYGESRHAGDRHIIWCRVGTHAIFDAH